MTTPLGRLLAAVALLLATAPRPGRAQGGAEEVGFDRPEAWALKYFAAVSTSTGVGPPVARKPWAVDLGLELGWIPSLSEAQRTVGFNGTKVEDLNKLPVFVRPRVVVGLPAGFSAELSWVPPVEVRGVTSNLFGAAIERPFLDRGRWTLGLRAHGQLGEVKGDFTCPEDVATLLPGSAGNPYGCEGPSSDVSTLNQAGLAVTGGVDIAGDGVFHFAGGATYDDLEFQVDAVTYGELDRTHLVTEGWTGWVSAGVGWPLNTRTWLGGEAFWSPLSVRRGVDAPSTEDGLFNLRVMLRYHLR